MKTLIHRFFSIESRSNIPTVRKSTDNINPRIKLKKGTPIFSIFLKPNLITLLKGTKPTPVLQKTFDSLFDRLALCIYPLFLLVLFQMIICLTLLY